jgi:RecJ-like exonuclease
MSVKIGTCGECHGTSTVAHARAGEEHACFRCNGNGVVKRADRYHGYANATTAATAMRNGRGMTCPECKGTGKGRFPMTTNCYSCKEGNVIESAMPGDSWAEIDRSLRYEHARKDAAKAYADAVEIRIIAQNRAGTWNEAHLGLGSIVSVTDYGRTWDVLATAARSGDEDTLNVALDALRSKIREESLNSFQWIKVITADDTTASVIGVILHRNGYTVQAVNAAPEHVSLPPTYTEEVLSRPV